MENNKLYFIATKNGTGKKVEVPNSDHSEEEGLISDPENYIKLEEGDSIASCFDINENTPIFCITEKGVGLRFKPSDLRTMGKEATGLRIIKLEDGDKLLDSFEIKDEEKMKIITYGDLTTTLEANDIPILKRGSRGVTIIKLNEGDFVDDVQI